MPETRETTSSSFYLSQVLDKDLALHIWLVLWAFSTQTLNERKYANHTQRNGKLY